MDLKLEQREILLERYVSQEHRHFFENGNSDGILFELFIAHDNLSDYWSEIYYNYVIARHQCSVLEVMSVKEWIASNIIYLATTFEEFELPKFED